MAGKRYQKRGDALVDVTLAGGVSSLIYQGATEDKAGVEGLVPPAQPAERDNVLKGDGTWVALPAEVDIDNNTIKKNQQGQLYADASAIVDVPIATTSKAGLVKPDGSSLTVGTDGSLAVSSSFQTTVENNISGKIPQPSTTTPKSPGTAAIGSSTTYARADHVHPSQSISVPSASTTTPKAPGTAAVGTSTAYARGDHVHPAQDAVTISGTFKYQFLRNSGDTFTVPSGGSWLVMSAYWEQKDIFFYYENAGLAAITYAGGSKITLGSTGGYHFLAIRVA